MAIQLNKTAAQINTALGIVLDTKPWNNLSLDDLTNATITSPANRHGLFYNNSTSQFENRALVEADISDLGNYITASSTDTLTNKSGSNSQWTNDEGYITDYTVTQLDVTQHEAALSITESQISDLQSYLTNVVEDTTPQLGGELDAQGNSIVDLADITFKTGGVGGTLRTGTSNADKFELQAYDVDGSSYQKVLQIDAGNEPQLEVFSDSFAIWDNMDESKRLFFTLSGGTTGVTTEIAHSPTANRTITFPDATDTLIGKNTTDTLTNKTINGNSNTISNLDIGNEVNWASTTDVTDRSATPASGDKLLLFEAGVGLRKIDWDDLPSGATSLNDLDDVSSSTEAAGQTIIYNATASEYQNSTLTGGSGISITNGDASITIAVDEVNINHNNLQNYVANEHIDWTSASSNFSTSGTGSFDGKLDLNGGMGLGELSSDPTDPAEGTSVMWQSDGTGSGDDGDIMMKITAGGVTKTTTLIDFSAV